MKNIENPALTDADYRRDPSLRQFPSTEFGKDHAHVLQLARDAREHVLARRWEKALKHLDAIESVMLEYQHD